MLDFLINEVIQLQWFVNIRLKLRVQESCLYFLEKELTHSALEFRCDLLRLHADKHWWYFCTAIRFFHASKHSAECCFTRSILAHHNNDFRISELAGFDFKVE